MEISGQIAIEEPRLTVKAEDDCNFAALVQVHSQFVFRIAYAITRHIEDAEDVVQDTFLKIYRAQAWRRIEDEKAFLARTAWRVAVDKLSRRRREKGMQVQGQRIQGSEDTMVARDRIERVHRLIDALPEELRQPLALSTVDELNSREIGDVLGIPEGTVRTRLMRARQILKEQVIELEGRYGTR